MNTLQDLLNFYMIHYKNNYESFKDYMIISQVDVFLIEEFETLYNSLV